MIGQAEKRGPLAAGWTAASGARLKLSIRNAGLQQAAVAELAGLSRPSLVQILNGNSVPRMSNLEAICNAIGIEPDDILDTERWDKFGPPDLSQPMAGDFRAEDIEYAFIKRYRVSASAGPGLFPLSETSDGAVAFERRWLIDRGIAKDMAGLITAEGDSMAPTIPHGASILVSFAESDVKSEGVYVFRRDNAVSVKRIKPLTLAHDGRPRALAVISDNPAFPPAVVSGADLKEMRIIGRVKYVMFDVPL